MDLSKAIKALQKKLPADVDLSTELEALQSALQAQLSVYEGLDPGQAREAIAQVGRLENLNNQLNALAQEKQQLAAQLAEQQNSALQAQRSLVAVRGLVQAGLKPEYEELILPAAASAIAETESGLTAPDGYWDSLKERFPDMFYQAEGQGIGAPAETAQVSSGPKYSIDANGFVQVS